MRNDKEVQFRYNATVPTTIEQFKKKNRVDVAREKLVDRVKKLKRQAPRVGHHHQAHFNHLKLTQQRDDPTFFHNNYSEIVVEPQQPPPPQQQQQSNNLINRLKKYHQDHYQNIILNFSSNSGSSSSSEERSSSDEREKKKRFMKRRKRDTTITVDTPRRKLISSISQQTSYYKYKKRRIQLQQQQQLLVDEEQKRQDERLQIRNKMLNFIIPADWTTCIIINKRKSLNNTRQADILSHQLLLKDLVKTMHHQQLDIEYQMKRISAHKLLIQDYHHKLFKLNQSLDKLPSLSDIHGLTNEEEEEEEILLSKSSCLNKNSYLLKQAYRQHLRLVKKMDRFKNKMSTTIRLDYLQLKVQSLQHQTSFLQSCAAFPFITFLGLLVLTSTFILV